MKRKIEPTAHSTPLALLIGTVYIMADRQIHQLNHGNNAPGNRKASQWRSLAENERTGQMEPTIKCGQHLAEHTNISGSKFHDVNLSSADFDNVNLSKARFHNINLSDIEVSAVQIGGATFKHVGPPPDKDGKQARQRPVTFEEAMLCDSTFRKVDLSNVKIIDCCIQGMTIDGVLVADLLKEYNRRIG